ncbi:MAG: SGNH/GDSL hydrolase family protein [Aphanothece sp. CMT-3BRIN-NPC111]|jgi:lysophospholipase L1-like esterase|nr:SGNH/GDSL hydrolase family protein [Aphanothece sp. CMT-3BRIN-NPC111]
MNSKFLRISIYLNIILLCTVLVLIYKLGLLDGAISAIYRPLELSQNLDEASSIQLPTDTLVSDPGWQNQVKNQVNAIQGKEYKSCLFGDSISAGLQNSIAPRTFNFALNGMSTVSLVEQLKILTAAHLKCNQIIIAIGTNDALYHISDDSFIKNMQYIIAIARKTGTQQIVLIPAFYATITASHDSKMAGTNEIIDEINVLIDKIGVKEQVFVAAKSIQALFKNHALNEKLTIDGVHLNEDGLTLYRLALLEIIYKLPFVIG